MSRCARQGSSGAGRGRIAGEPASRRRDRPAHQKLGEADRIITILTREHGRVRLVAKGVRRTTSKFGARLEPFAARGLPGLLQA